MVVEHVENILVEEGKLVIDDGDTEKNESKNLRKRTRTWTQRRVTIKTLESKIEANVWEAGID